jgi:hypothetical protein
MDDTTQLPPRNVLQFAKQDIDPRVQRLDQQIALVARFPEALRIRKQRQQVLPTRGAKAALAGDVLQGLPKEPPIDVLDNIELLAMELRAAVKDARKAREALVKTIREMGQAHD